MTATRTPLLDRLGLSRPELRAWALYDWANSAMITVVVTAVYPVYFSKVLCSSPGADPEAVAQIATQRHTWITTGSMCLVAVLSPLLGTLADMGAARKRFLAAFLTLGVAATGGMGLLQQGDWAWGMALFGLANLGRPEASCSTTRSCPQSRARTSTTASRRRPTRWVTWVAACCWR